MWGQLVQLAQSIRRPSAVSPENQIEEQVANDGPDEEEQAASVPNAKEPTRTIASQTKKNTILVVALAICIGVLVGVLAAKPWQSGDDQKVANITYPWPHEKSDIEQDPSVTYGSLENGLRYMVMQNAEPPNQLALRMHINVGSYHEEEDQLGLAHFLEHMAFNGLRNFDADELIPVMQRLGIAFGAHANAATSFDETFYEYDLPNSTDVEALNLVFTVMRDYADGMLLEKEEIDKERGVILSEMNIGDSIDWRLTKKLYSFLLPGHLLPLRWVIGDADVISTAPRQRFVDFYEKYYTPDRITFIAVGDADPDEIENRIKESFMSMPAKDQSKMDDEIDLGSLTTGTGFEAAVFADEELVNEEMFIVFARPYKPFGADTESERVSQLPLRLAHSILSRRLQIAAKKEGSPFRSGKASGSGREGLLGRSGIEIGEVGVKLATPVTEEENGAKNWIDSIPILEQEFRKALLYGFAPHEFAEVKADYMNHYQRRVETAPTRKSQSLANHLMDTIKDQYVFTSPQEDLRIFSDAVESMSLDDIHEAFIRFWDTSDLKLVLFAKKFEPDTIKVMEQTFIESKEVEVKPPEMSDNLTFLYTSFGVPGQIISDTTHEDLSIRQLQLSNNVRVNLKRTDFQANTIRIALRFGTGRLSQPELPGLQWFTDVLIEEGGLGRHSNDDLNRILAGKTVAASFSVREGFFKLSGTTKPDDLELQMQLLAAQVLDPGFREEAMRYWKQIIPSEDQWFRSDIGGAQYRVNEFLRGNDTRFAVPSLDEMDSLTMADAKDWLEYQLASSYMEVSVVGTFDMDSTIAIILSTLGALPERDELPPIVDNEFRSLQYPETPGERLFSYESKLNVSSSIVVWKVPHIEKDIRLTRRFDILASVLDDRMRKQIREDLGESYSPYATTDISDEFSWGVLRAESKGTPDVSESIGHLMISIAMNVKDMEEDELLRAKKPILADIEQHILRSNGYWLNVMLQSQAKPWRLEWARSFKEDYESITLSELQELAAAYLQPKNAIRIEIHPADVLGGAN